MGAGSLVGTRGRTPEERKRNNMKPDNEDKSFCFERLSPDIQNLLDPTVPEGHKHRVTTPEKPRKIPRTPTEARRTLGETPQNPRRDPQSPLRDPRRALREANFLGEPRGGLCPSLRNFSIGLGQVPIL